MVTKKIKHKGSDGTIIEVDIGAEAENIDEDENHRFMTDAEKIKWNAANIEINKIQRTAIVALTAAGWSASAPYSQRVSVPGMKAADNPELLLYAPNTLTAAAVKLRQKLTGMITDGVTADGAVTLYCGVKKPTADFQIVLKGVSGNG